MDNNQSIEMFGDVKVDFNDLNLCLSIKHIKGQELEETVDIFQTGNYSVVCEHKLNINVGGCITTVKNESDDMHIIDCRMESAFNDVYTIRICHEGYE